MQDQHKGLFPDVASLIRATGAVYTSVDNSSSIVSTSVVLAGLPR